MAADLDPDLKPYLAHIRVEDIAASYTVNWRDRIGKGGNASVYSCVRNDDGQQCVVKLLFGHLKRSLPECMIHLYASTRIPEHVVNVLDVYENNIRFAHGTSPCYLLVLERCEIDLFDHMAKSPGHIVDVQSQDPARKFPVAFPNHSLTEGVARDHFRYIVQGVDKLHDLSIAHRDLKPENVFLDEQSRPKIGDFGHAKIMRGAINSVDISTDLYRSPEVTSGRYFFGIDTFAFGAILFFMLSGRPPANEWSHNAAERNAHTDAMLSNFPWIVPDPVTLLSTPAVSPSAVALIRSLLEANPEARAQAKGALASDWLAPLIIAPLEEPAAPADPPMEIDGAPAGAAAQGGALAGAAAAAAGAAFGGAAADALFAGAEPMVLLALNAGGAAEEGAVVIDLPHIPAPPALDGHGEMQLPEGPLQPFLVQAERQGSIPVFAGFNAYHRKSSEAYFQQMKQDSVIVGVSGASGGASTAHSQ